MEIADIHNIEFELYSLDGKLIKSSTATTGVPGNTFLDTTIVKYFKQPNPKRYVETDNNTTYFKSSYSLVTDFNNLPIGIIYIPYFLEKDDIVIFSDLRLILLLFVVKNNFLNNET